jgi:hypothetical protein
VLKSVFVGVCGIRWKNKVHVLPVLESNAGGRPAQVRFPAAPVSRHDVNLGPDPDTAGQRQAIRVVHDEAASRHPPADPPRVVVAVYPVDGPFARPVRQGDLERTHVVQRVPGRDRRGEFDPPCTEHLPGVGGGIAV